MKDEGNDNADSDADGEKYAIGREADQYSDHDYGRNHQPGRAFYVDRRTPEHHNNNEIVVRRKKLV